MWTEAPSIARFQTEVTGDNNRKTPKCHHHSAHERRDVKKVGKRFSLYTFKHYMCLDIGKKRCDTEAPSGARVLQSRESDWKKNRRHSFHSIHVFFFPSRSKCSPEFFCSLLWTFFEFHLVSVSTRCRQDTPEYTQVFNFDKSLISSIFIYTC